MKSALVSKMAAVDTSLPGLLDTLTASLTSATSAFPSESDTLLPPADGISLLDVKNELLLSYLQNLVFLIILKLRNDPESANLGAEATKKLNEQRVYLEKGVRPLEGKLKYQIDKVLRAADEAERSLATKKAPKKLNNDEALYGETESDASDSSDSDTSAPAAEGQAIPDISYQPNPANLLRKADQSTAKATQSGQSGAYRPPRITATSMPSEKRSEPKNSQPKIPPHRRIHRQRPLQRPTSPTLHRLEQHDPRPRPQRDERSGPGDGERANAVRRGESDKTADDDEGGEEEE